MRFNIFYSTGRTLLAIFIASLFIVIPKGEAFASTFYSSGESFGTLELKQTGVCCSGPDNYRFWSSFYSDIPQTTYFNIIRFQASTTASSLEIHYQIYSDTNGNIDFLTDGYYSNDPSSDDTLIGSFTTLTATKSGDIFTAQLPASIQIGSGNYIRIYFSQSSSMASTTFTTSDGFGMSRTVQGGTPNNYEYKTERIQLELCSNSECNTSFGEFLPVDFFKSYSSHFNTAVPSGTSTSMKIDVGYYIDLADNFTTQDRPDFIRAHVFSSGNPNFDSGSKIITPLSNGNATSTINLTEIYPDGEYGAYINFYNVNTGDSQAVLNSRLILNFRVSGGVVSTSTVTREDDSFAFETSGVFTPQNCGITEIDGCINNSIAFLFLPSPGSYNGFVSSINVLQTKFPFVYLYQ